MILFEDSAIDIFENGETKRIIMTNGRILFISLPPIIYMITVRF